MFSYFIAGIKIAKMVSSGGRQVIPIAPFFSKHYIDHHIHLQSFQVCVKAFFFFIYVSLAALISQYSVWRFFSPKLILKNKKGKSGCGESSLFVNSRCFVSPGIHLVPGQRSLQRLSEKALVRGFDREASADLWVAEFLWHSLSDRKTFIISPRCLRSIGETNKTRGIKCALWNRSLS